MLETIREYARERLTASGEEPELRGRMALYTADLVEATSQAIWDGGNQVELVARLAAESDNARAALEWSRDQREDAVLLRLAAALAHYWRRHGPYQEEEAWFALALERGTSPLHARMRLLGFASDYARFREDYDRADALDAEWRLLAEEAGDELQLLSVVNSEARTALDRGDHDRARAQFIALRDRYRAIGDRRSEAAATVNIGLTASDAGDFATGLACAEEAAEVFREVGDDGGIAAASINVGVSAVGLGAGARAEQAFRDGLTVSAQLKWKRGVIANAAGLAAALVLQHQEERAAQLLGAAASLREDLGISVDYEEMHDRAHAEAKAALGDEAFAAAWARGEGMTTEEIVAFTTAA
jgi:non-specific serine/threonine protein kinase